MSIIKDYRDYILNTKADWFDIEIISDDVLKLICNDIVAFINFYDLDFKACEFIVNNEDDPISYLHFEVTDLTNAKNLYNDFLEQLRKEALHQTLRVLLVCSVGGTTTHFAYVLNDAAQFLSLDIRFDSDGSYALGNRADKFDVILVAPQVRYQYNEIKQMFPDHSIILIPTDIFSKYDSAGMLFKLHDEGLI